MIKEAIRDPTKNVVDQLSQNDRKTLRRSNSSPIAFHMGNHIPVTRPNLSGRASQLMRQDFLEQAIQKDSNGTIHVEDFGSLLHPPTDVSKWVPNSASDGCQRCKRIFSIMRNRRHHCRYCGLLVCFKCSQARVVFHEHTDPVRVCIRCMFKIVGRIDALYTRRYMRAVLSNNHSGDTFSTKDLLSMRETTDIQEADEEEEAEDDDSTNGQDDNGESGGSVGGGRPRNKLLRRHSSSDLDSASQKRVVCASCSDVSDERSSFNNELTAEVVRRLTDVDRSILDGDDDDDEEEDDDTQSIVISDKDESVGEVETNEVG